MDIKTEINNKLAIIESRPVHTADVINRITKLFEKRVDSWYIADGSVGLFRDHDGQAYEITIRPASEAKYGQMLGTHPQKHAARKVRTKSGL